MKATSSFLVTNLKRLNELQDHPYRNGEYFINSNGEIFLVLEDDEENQELIDSHVDEGVDLFYAVLWEGTLTTEDDNVIYGVYYDEDEVNVSA